MMRDAGDILFISLSNLGDAILTTPVLAALHQHFPAARITILAGLQSSAIFEHCPYRAELIQKPKRAGLTGLLALLRCLRRRRYDLVVDVRTDGLAYLLRARRRCTKWTARPYGPHAVEQHMGVIRVLHQEQSIPAPRVWLHAEDVKYAGRAVAALPQGRWLAIAPGCRVPIKRWPAENYPALVHAVSDLFSGVIVVGDAGDAALAEAICCHLPLPVLNLAGQTDIRQAAAVIQRAAVFVGSDSGLGHLASAVGVATLTLFGIGEPERYRPWGERSAWLVGADRDVRNLSVPQVAEALRAQCAAAGAGP
jgi:ADP-heptose:LPS heptosyltransferase